MSTAHEIVQAIRGLAATERDKLLRIIPQLFPEIGGDAEWERIVRDDHPRPALTRLLDEAEKEFGRNPAAFPEIKASDLSPS